MLLIMFYHGSLKDYLPKLLNHLLRLIIVLHHYYTTKITVRFAGSCSKQSKISYKHGNLLQIYIVYELGASGFNNSDPTLKNCLFGAVTLTKTQILINMGILVMELDLIEDQVFHFLVVDLAEMY